MARPTEEGLKYFTHDTDASTDEKIETLRMFFGNDGYAFYFILLERIYRSNDAELDISDAETIQILAKKLMITEVLFAEILKKSLKVGLFDKAIYDEKKVLTSNGIRKRSKVVLHKREGMRERYHTQKNEPSSCIVSDAETQKEQGKVEYSKVNNIKEKESKENNFPHFIKVYEEEYKTLITPAVAEQLKDIYQEYGFDIFYAATKKVAGTSKCNLSYVRPIMEEYKIKGIPDSNGKKPQEQSKPLVGKDGWGVTL